MVYSEEIKSYARSKRIECLIRGARAGELKRWFKYFDIGPVVCYKTKDNVTGIVYTVYDRPDGTRTILEGIRDITAEASA